MKYNRHTIEGITKLQLEHLIDEYIIGFRAERNRAIMKRKLIDGITYEELSYEFDLSVNQVKNIVYNGLRILTKHIEVRA